MTFVLQRSPEFSLIPSGSSFVTPLRLIARTSRIVLPTRTYWDPKLRELQELRRLVGRLRELGLIGFRREIRGRIGILL